MVPESAESLRTSGGTEGEFDGVDALLQVRDCGCGNDGSRMVGRSASLSFNNEILRPKEFRASMISKKWQKTAVEERAEARRAEWRQVGMIFTALP